MRILIIGGGIAGTSAAIHLTGEGFEVHLVDHRETNDLTFKHGESLPPQAGELLKELGVWEQFYTSGHQPSYANKSAWGSARLTYQNSLNHPLGHGWHIDRVAFEDILTRRAKELGTFVNRGVSIQSIHHSKEHWSIGFRRKDGETSEQTFSFVIDASGRNGWLARKMGIRKRIVDRQLALILAYKVTQCNIDQTTLVETTPLGWWYSAVIPGDRLIMNFFSRPSKDERKRWLQDRNWNQLFTGATHSQRRLESAQSQLLQAPRFVSADTAILDHLIGENWMAIGDAAMTYDPVASHGMTMAMVSARDAAHSIKKYLSGEKEALERYEHLMQSSFEYYCIEREKIYAQEQRFAGHAYWDAQN